MKRDHLTRLRQKVISYLASFLMVISLFPTNTVLAQEEYTYEPVAVTNAQADSEEPTAQGDGPAGFAFDNDYSTQWHTNWSNPSEGDKAMPHWISWQLNQPTTIGRIDYVGKPGANGIGNGVFKDISIYVTEDSNAQPNGAGEGWELVQSYSGITYSATSGTEHNRTATFTFTPVMASKVLIVVNGSYSVPDDPDGENVFANAREIITYKATAVEPEPVTPDGYQGMIEIADNGIRQEGTKLYVTLEHQINRLNASIDGTSWTYDGDKTLTFTSIPETGAFFGNFSVFDQDGRLTQHNIFREADGTWRVVVEYRSGVTYKDEQPSFYYGDDTADKQLVLDGSEEYTIYTTSGTPTIKAVGRHLESLQYSPIDVSGPTMTVYPEDDTDHTTLSATLKSEGSYRVIITDKVRTGTNKATSFKLNVVKGEEPGTVDKTALQALYDEVKGYVSDDTSYGKFEAARDNAKAVLDNADATQEEVNNAYNTLNQRYWLSKVDGMVKKYRPIESSSGNFNYELYVAESTLPIIRVYVEARNHTNTSYPAEELEKLYNQFVEAEKELKSAGEKPRSVMVGPDVDQINTTSDRGRFAITEYQEDGKLYLHIEYINDGINLIKGTDLGTISNYDLKNKARVNLIGYAYEEDGSLGGYSNTPITSKMEPLEGETDFAAGFQVNVEVQPGKYGAKLTLTGGKKEQANSYGYYYTSEPEVEVVDKAKLQEAIKEAEKLEEIYYTEDSWNNLQTVLADAKKV
ncbi:discoidin domain-containing protein, partial [uncultured Faecalicoccus sp.]|uniref:discoidin domain-containing protein n=1 Tax=uncultured Faecalicoccus sp. TaxID=1971760 RepID=UPI0025E85D84